MLFGAIEAGGTKMVLAVGDENGKIHEMRVIPTEEPEITLPKIMAFFDGTNVAALGIGAFGPVNLRRGSRDYGRILHTPKRLWQGLSWTDAFAEMGCPLEVDTDVNAACLGEVMHGNGIGLSDVVYITVGTGIGAGVWSQGKLLHGTMHPEAGHIPVRPHPSDTYEGNCPFHKCCLEGMAAGPALEKRCGVRAEELPCTDPVWELEAEYIAQALMTYTLCYSPQKIILGGGVMKQPSLPALIREKTAVYLNGYIENEALQDMENYIVTAGLEGRQGIVGCLALAGKAWNERRLYS